MSNTGQSFCPTTGKVQYDSAKAAHIATVGVRRRRKQSDRSGHGHHRLETPYQCVHCGGWHLGRRWSDRKRHDADDRAGRKAAPKS